MNRVSLVAAALLALIPVSCGGEASVEEPPTAGRPAPESPATVATPDEDLGDGPGADAAPDFTVETFEGEIFTLSDHRGTAVVLNFFESW